MNTTMERNPAATGQDPAPGAAGAPGATGVAAATAEASDPATAADHIAGLRRRIDEIDDQIGRAHV